MQLSNRCEIRLAGEGGQGVVTGGLVLAEAVAIYQGKNVVMSQSYHPQQRGGSARAEVIISDEEIDYPKVLEADIFLALSQDAYERYHRQMKRNGVIIVESTRVGGELAGHVKVYKVPLEEVSIESSGTAVGSNFVALGVISGLRGIVSPPAVKAAIKARAPKGTRELNVKAFKAGIEIGRSLKRDRRLATPV